MNGGGRAVQSGKSVKGCFLMEICRKREAECPGQWERVREPRTLTWHSVRRQGREVKGTLWV